MHKYQSSKLNLKAASGIPTSSLTTRTKAPQDMEFQATQFIIKNELEQLKSPSSDEFYAATKRSVELTPQNKSIHSNRQPIINLVSNNKEQKEDAASSSKNKKASSLGLLRNKSILSVAKNKENVQLYSPKQSCKSSQEQGGVQSFVNKSILYRPQQSNQTHLKHLPKNGLEQSQKLAATYQMSSEIHCQKSFSIKEQKNNMNIFNQQSERSCNENAFGDTNQPSLLLKNKNALGINIQISKIPFNKASQTQDNKGQKKQKISLQNPLFYTSIDGSGLSLTRPTSLDISQDYRLTSPQISEQIHFRQFSNASELLCNQSQEINQPAMHKENEVFMIERNNQIPFSSLPISGQLHKALNSLTKKQVHNEDDCFVPSELQNQSQMNSNISKLQKMEMVRASDIDYLNVKEGSSQQNNSFESCKNSLRSISTYSQLELNTFDCLNSEESAVKRNNHRRNNSGIVNATISLCKKRSKSKIFQEKESYQEKSRQSSEKKIIKQIKELIKVDDIDNKELLEQVQDIDEKNVPQTFMSLEKQSTLSIKHKNKFTRRNCTCDNDFTKLGSCLKVKSWLAQQRGDIDYRENITKGLQQIDEKIMAQIQKDLERTHQSHEFFWSPHVQLSIQHILCQFVMKFPEAGYVQGMNLIAGIFVWHGDEISSLQLFNSANSKLNFVELFKPGFPGLQKHLKIIEVLMMLNIPEIFAIMAKFEITPQMFISEWILVLFSDIIPLEFSHLVIEGIFEEGWIFFYRLTLNLLKVMLESVQNLQDSGEILLILKQLKFKQEEYKINWGSLLKCKQPWISDILIDQLASHMLINKSQTVTCTIQQY